MKSRGEAGQGRFGRGQRTHWIEYIQTHTFVTSSAACYSINTVSSSSLLCNKLMGLGSILNNGLKVIGTGNMNHHDSSQLKWLTQAHNKGTNLNIQISVK